MALTSPRRADLGGSPGLGAGAGSVARPVAPERGPVLDRLSGASRRFPIHALVELDAPLARERIASTQGVSWTGFIIATMARAVACHPDVNARRAGNRILSFNWVDIGATVERQWQGRSALDVIVIPQADALSCLEISHMLHKAKFGAGQAHPTHGLAAQLVRLPGPVRRAAIRAAATSPRVAATFGPAVGVTSLGMFSRGWGWGIPLSPLTVMATVGGVADRPVVRDGTVVVRPMLPLTITFDHAIVDGAPATRFVETLRELTESAAAL